MPYSNRKLRKARSTKNDEFRTPYNDIEMELSHYWDKLRGKTIYCPCDDIESNFYKYLKANFDAIGIKYLRCTSYVKDGNGTLIGYDGKTECVTPLNYDGDMFDERSEYFFKYSDVIITNPPFSLFIDFIEMLYDYSMDFIIVGNLNAVNYKEVFHYIKDNRLWMGATNFHCGASYFIANKEDYTIGGGSSKRPYKEENGVFYWRVNGVRWFTNIDNEKRHIPIELTEYYSPDKYPKYDKLDAIECNVCVNIPIDYDGLIGVPVSFIDRYDPSQFEIVGQMVSKKVEGLNYGYPIIDGKKKFSRILIRHKAE